MAGEEIGSLVVNIEANMRNLQDGLNNATERVEGFGNKIGKLGGLIAGAFAFGAVAEFGKKLVTTASDAAEMQSKFNTVFANMSTDAEAWATKFQDDVGGSRVEIKGMIADSQDMLTGFGASTDAAFGLSTKFQTLGTDLASFTNLQGGAAEGVDRVRKGLLGEHENLKALGIIINENVLAQKLSSEGDKRKFNELTELEKIELRYRIAVDQSKNAQGDAAKTSQGFANQMRNLEGRITDATARLGDKLLPITTEFVKFITDKLPVVEDFIFKGINELAYAFKLASDNADILIPILAGVTAAFVAQKIIAGVTILMDAYRAATVGATLAQKALNLVMGLSPFGRVALLIGTLVAAGVALYQNWDTVKTKATELWVSIENTFKTGINAAIEQINKLIGIMNKIPGVKVPLISRVRLDTSQNTTAEGLRAARNANGTDNFKGGLSWVGERGKELLNLPKGSQIIPHKESMTLTQGQSSMNYENMFNGATFNVRSDNDIKSIAREIFNLQKTKARGSGVVYG